MDWKRLLNPTFLILAATLAAGTAFVHGWVAAFGLHPIKDPVPMQASLEHFPAEIGAGQRSYIRIDEHQIHEEELNFLFDGGMKPHEDYLQWFLAPESEAREILLAKQRRVRLDPDARRRWPAFAEADLTDPVVLREHCKAKSHPELGRCKHLVSLFITYYTGSADTVPHVPERCYLGGGNTLEKEEVIHVPSPGIAWGQREAFPVKVLSFIRNVQDAAGLSQVERSMVGYYFVANWQYMDEDKGLDLRWGVRLTLADPRRPEAFFTKVEVKFVNLLQDRGGLFEEAATQDEVVANLREFLGAVAPIYERSFLSPPPGEAGQSAGREAAAEASYQH